MRSGRDRDRLGGREDQRDGEVRKKGGRGNYVCIIKHSHCALATTLFSLLLSSPKDIAEANFRTSSSRLLAAVMSALCNTSVKLTSILPIAYDGEVLLRSRVKQVSTENDSALAHRFPLLVAHMEKLSHVSKENASFITQL